VLFSFNLLSEFQRASDPALRTYKQPAALRFAGFSRPSLQALKRKSLSKVAREPNGICVLGGGRLK
jgi:hypothetical protein